MTDFEESTLVLSDGIKVQQYLWQPHTPPSGGVILVHGLGDHLLRYEHIAQFFRDRGYACLGVDLPGHGKNSGQRGHIPRWTAFHDILDEGAKTLTTTLRGTSNSLGLFGHSMGGFIALDYLVRRPGLIDFLWLSSPLLRPSQSRPSWMISLAKVAGRIAPRIPWDTGVRSAHCLGEEDSQNQLQPRNEDGSLHHLTTLGFGRQLLLKEEELAHSIARVQGNTSLLVTHGTEDEVCPLRFSEELVETIPLKDKRLHVLEGQRHEPIHGERCGEVLEATDQWLSRSRLAH